MSDDNMQNDDFNKNEIPSADDDISGLNPAMNMPSDDDMTTAGDGGMDFQTQQQLNENAVDYDFNEMQGTPANASEEEVKIDEAPQNDDGPVTVRPVEFTPFDSYTPTNTDTNKNLELLMDIKLELTVELGRCQLPVKKVLELTRGSIIELDKVAGESVELFANGKHVANGEVVVIEDNFGLRITSITDPEERIKSL